MARSKEMQELLNSFGAMIGYKMENQAEGKCVKCGEVAAPRCTTAAGQKDFQIHGICEVCYDAIFQEPGEV